MLRFLRWVPLALLLAGCGRTNHSPTQPSDSVPLDPLAPQLTVRVDNRDAATAIVGLSEVTFDARGTPGDKLQYEIQFGDGHSASTPQAAHVYESEGTFTAILTVTDAGGRHASASKPVVAQSLRGTWFHSGYIERNRRAEVFRLTIGTQEGPSVAGVYAALGDADRHFTGTVTGARALRLMVDGGRIQFEGVIPDEILAEGQPWPLMVRGGPADGLTLAFQPVVGDPSAAPPAARLAISYSALFTGEAMMGMTPITFDGSFSQGERLSHLIEFGDGTFAAAPTAIHAIDRKGSFTARLTVTDRFGRFDTTQQVVKVGAFTDHPGLMGYTAWVNYLEPNPSAGRNEFRILDFLTHDGRRFTGRYLHPDCCGNYSPFHGTVDGAGGIEFALDDRTIVFTGRAIHDQPSPLMRLALKGGSANGLTLDFRFEFYF